MVFADHVASGALTS
jgi:hypothetical protein